MITIGIELGKNRAICFALEQDSNISLKHIEGDFKYLNLDDDTDNNKVREFKTNIYNFFDNISPNRIAILTRQTKGKFASSPISFKLEGLIQCYKKVEIEFVAPKTLNAFYKKNTLEIEFKHNYQEKSAKLANYLLNQ